MSIEENVQTVKDFLRQSAAAIGKGCWRCLPKILVGSFRARTGRGVPLLAELLRAVAKPFPQTPGIAKLTGTNSLLIR